MEMFLLFDREYVSRHEDGTEPQRDDKGLRRGSYFMVTSSRLSFVILGV